MRVMIKCFQCMDLGIVIIREFAFKAVKWNKRIKGFPEKRHRKDGSAVYFDPMTKEELDINEVEEYDYCYEKAYRCVCVKGNDFKNCKSIASMPFYQDIAKNNKADYETWQSKSGEKHLEA